MKSIRITYNEVVNIDKENNEIITLDGVFEHSKTFKGATGSVFEAVSKAQYKKTLEKANVIDYIMNSGIGMVDDKNISKNKANTIYKELKENNELVEFIFDLSYQYIMWDKIREFGYTENEYPVFNCIGGGRCFNKDFEGNTNKHLSKIIQKYEKN